MSGVAFAPGPKLFVLNENAAKHLLLHLDPCQSTQPSHGLDATYNHSVKINDPNKRDLYTSGVWVESVSPVADLCPANQLVYQTVQSGTAE